MKTLFCANIYETGIVGPARFAEMLLRINDLYKGQHEVRILTADVSEEQFPVYKMNLRYPKPLRFLDMFFRGWAFYRGIRRIQKEYDYDVLFFGHAIAGIVPKFLLRNIRVGGMITDYMTARVTWRNFLKVHGGKGLLLQKQFEKFSTHYLDYIIVCSGYLKQYISKTYHCPEGRIFRLYQGVDVANIPFYPRRIESGRAVRILFVKWRYLVGGLPELASALYKLNSCRFQLSVVGPHLLEKENILQMFEGINHVELEFFGPCAQDAVHRQMAEHHILCIPSRLEAQGLSNIEGLAHGISVVSSGEGGIPEVMDNGKNGWLCELENPESLAQALRECIEATPKERLVKQTNGRKFVEECFDFPGVINHLLIILENPRT
jgi:glycosyltransferase involved in cell wall biosynthesis